jgi:hypothetical protein
LSPPDDLREHRVRVARASAQAKAPARLSSRRKCTRYSSSSSSTGWPTAFHISCRAASGNA